MRWSSNSLEKVCKGKKDPTVGVFENLTLKEYSYGWLNLVLHFEKTRAEKDSLRKIFKYYRDEEKEDTSMLLEWIRRNDDVFSKEMKTYLFQDEKEIATIEETN